jgi:hypothetical protein
MAYRMDIVNFFKYLCYNVPSATACLYCVQAFLITDANGVYKKRRQRLQQGAVVKMDPALRYLRRLGAQQWLFTCKRSFYLFHAAASVPKKGVAFRCGRLVPNPSASVFNNC